MSLLKKRRPAPVQPAPEPTLKQRLERAKNSKSAAEVSLLTATNRLEDAAKDLDGVKRTAEEEITYLAEIADAAHEGAAESRVVSERVAKALLTD